MCLERSIFQIYYYIIQLFIVQPLCTSIIFFHLITNTSVLITYNFENINL
jgi:hypothetical protein